MQRGSREDEKGCGNKHMGIIVSILKSKSSGRTWESGGSSLITSNSRLLSLVVNI